MKETKNSEKRCNKQNKSSSKSRDLSGMKNIDQLSVEEMNADTGAKGARLGSSCLSCYFCMADAHRAHK